MTKRRMKQALMLAACASLAGCTASSAASSGGTVSAAEEETEVQSASDITVLETMENTADGEHVIAAEGTEASYANVKAVKSGDASGDEADFYGENSAVFASDGADLTLEEVIVETDGTHANAVFSYGEGTAVTIRDSVIQTYGDCSGGLMTTGGGTMYAENLTVHTYGRSSAAIRSDRGGGTVTVTGGTYTAEGSGSPAVYSTADITVSDAELISVTAEGIVVEGNNSVTLNNVTLTADNTVHNSNNASNYKAVMIYQSMSGDASEGVGSFAMNGGTLTNENGDVFFVTNTVAEIRLNDAEIINSGDGYFLRAEAAGWGSDGSNGGQVTLTAVNQVIEGDMAIDEISHLNLLLEEGSVFTGAVNTDGQKGEVYVELSGTSKWVLTADSYITSLTCSADSVDLNGYTLYVNGEVYSAGTSSEGKAIEAVKNAGQGGAFGQPPEKPGGENGEPPEKPDGDHKEPPQKPE